MSDSNQIELIANRNLTRNIVLLGWAVAMLGGFTWLCAYSNSAGAIEVAPDCLALDFEPSQKDTSVLLLFFHPRCPCTWATARQLERAVQAPTTPVKILAYALLPENLSEEDRTTWSQTNLSGFISKLPNAEVVFDVGGAEALRYGALTSGTVLFYDDSGQLKFHGGITSSRGHEGDAIGSDAIVSLLLSRDATHSEAPVFGCALFP